VTEILEAMTAPTVDGQPSLPRRAAPRGLLPTTWVGRTLKVEYVDSFGVGAEATGACLDLYPFGIVMNLSGQRAAVSWDALRVVTLMND
jgi:hypothetical protein